MGTRRSRHNKGRKPLYKEHGADFSNKRQIDEFPRVGFDFLEPENFLLSPAARALSKEDVEPLSEFECAEMFKKIRFSQNGGEPWCHKCGCVELYSCTQSTGRRRYKCKACHVDISITARTPFAAHKKSHREMLLEIAHTVGKSPVKSAMDVARSTGVTQKASHVALHKLSQYLRSLKPNTEKPEEKLVTMSMSPKYHGGLLLDTRRWWTDVDTTRRPMMHQQKTRARSE